MNTQIQRQSAKLINKLLEAQYYPDLVASAMHKHDVILDNGALDRYTDEKLVSMWNDLWFSLPNDFSIRSIPSREALFYGICDLCVLD